MKKEEKKYKEDQQKSSLKGLFEAKEKGFDWMALIFIGVIILLSLIVFSL